MFTKIVIHNIIDIYVYIFISMYIYTYIFTYICTYIYLRTSVTYKFVAVVWYLT